MRRRLAYALSFGTFWSMRAAAAEPRFVALAGAVACYFWDNLTIFDEAPIRFKQIFMEMAGTHSEEQFDLMCQDFSLKPDVEKISCPTLMATGEFDPLSPLEDATQFSANLMLQKRCGCLKMNFTLSERQRHCRGTASFTILQIG